MNDLLFGDFVRLRHRRPRVFFPRVDILGTVDDNKLYELYRFCREGITLLVDTVGEEIEHPTQRSNAVDPTTQICVALDYLSTGSFQRVVAHSRDLNLSQPTVCRIVHRFCNAMCRHKNEFITFPTSPAYIVQEQKAFYEMGNIPNVIGCIDCTHIRLLSPSINEEVYGNSLNVQLICDHRSSITNVVAKWPGSVHDSTILSNSTLPDYFENGGPHRKGLLLGDSGYACKNWLLTLYRIPDTVLKERFNRYSNKLISLK